MILVVAGTTEIVANLDCGSGAPVLEPPPHPDNAIAAIRISTNGSKRAVLASPAARRTSRLFPAARLPTE